MEKDTDLIKDNIIKDRRRRYLYLSKDRKSGLQIMEQELPKVTILKKMSMWSLLVFIVPFGIFKVSLTISLFIALIVFALGTVYFHFVILKDRNVVSLTDSELSKLELPEMIKAEKSNMLSEVLVPLLVVLIFVSRALDTKSPLNELDMNVAKFASAALAAYSAYLLPRYLTLRKKYKAVAPAKTKKSK